MNEKIVFSGVVEEYKFNMNSFSHWHFSCGRCGQRMRCKAIADGSISDFECPKCNTQIRALSDGRIFNVVAVDNTSLVRTEELNNNKTPAPKGLFNQFAEKLKTAEEETAGKKLREGLVSTGDCLQKLDDDVRYHALSGFHRKTSALKRDLPNWSREGRLKIARSLQQESKKKFDFDQAESYALWLAGAWLESRERETLDASFVHQTLCELINEIER